MIENVEVIYKQVKSEIINLDILPGTKISEDWLSTRFNISRTPIRSVITRLEQDGLLTVIPKKGTYVTKIDVHNTSNSMYIRESVESRVIYDIIKNVDPSKLVVLDEILAKQAELIKLEPSIEKSKAFYENDNLFHKTIFSLVGKEEIWEKLNDDATPLSRLRIIANMRKNQLLEEIYDMHSTLLKEIKEKNVEKALTVLINHLENGFNGINEIIEKNKDYFLIEEDL